MSGARGTGGAVSPTPPPSDQHNPDQHGSVRRDSEPGTAAEEDGETNASADANVEQTGDLSSTYAAVLAFEARWPRHSQRKADAIETTFGHGIARYYQLLNAAIDNPAAQAAAPELTAAVRMTRVRRKAQRTAKR